MGYGLQIAGGIGQGIWQGRDDVTRIREVDANLKKLASEQEAREIALRQAKDEEAAREEIKGLQRPGTKSYAKALENYGAGSEQARQLDAQTADFGQEGADMTASALSRNGEKAMGLKPKTYTEAAQARDMASIYQRRGMAKQAQEQSALSKKLAYEDYEKGVMDLIRASGGMSIDQFAQAAAKLKEDDETDVNAAVHRTADGQLMGYMYNKATGDNVSRPITGHDELRNFLIATLNPTHFQKNRELAQGDKKAEADMIGARAKETEARTHRDTYLQQVAADKWMVEADKERALAEQYRAEARQKQDLTPAMKKELEARARSHDANANSHNAQADKYKEEAKKWENKLPEWQLTVLKGDSLAAADAAKQLNKLIAEDPKNEGGIAAARLQAQRTNFQMLKKMQEFGAPGLEGQDLYALTGMDSPETTAKNIVSKKMDSKTSDAALAEIEKRMGADYANAVRKALPVAATPAPAAPGAPAPVPMGVDTKSLPYRLGSGFNELDRLWQAPVVWGYNKTRENASNAIEGAHNFYYGLTGPHKQPGK